MKTIYELKLNLIKERSAEIFMIMDNEIPKEGSKCIYLSVILINSVFRTGKSYYPQVFLE